MELLIGSEVFKGLGLERQPAGFSQEEVCNRLAIPVLKKIKSAKGFSVVCLKQDVIDKVNLAMKTFDSKHSIERRVAELEENLKAVEDLFTEEIRKIMIKLEDK